MMQPYRAIYRTRGGVGVPVIVVAAAGPGEFHFHLLAIDQSTGDHIEGVWDEFTCTEPTYLSKPGPDEPDHEHDFGGTVEPILNGSRLAEYRIHCTVPGCTATLVRPASGALVRG